MDERLVEAAPARAGDPVRNPGFERLALGQWFRNEIVDLKWNRASEVLVGVERAQHDVTERRIALGGGCDKAEAVQVRHVDVDEAQIEVSIGHGIEGVARIKKRNQL